MDSSWMLILPAAALLVRVGQAVGAMGAARAKTVASAGFRSLADLCIATLCFWALGAAISFQQGPSYLLGWAGLSPNWFRDLAMILIATGIVGPAVSERSRLVVPLSLGALLSGILVPIIFHWTQRGWLSHRDFIDDAGAASIHLTPALCAATAVLFVGPREGKYNRDGSSNMIPGHSVLMILLSLMLTFVGWVPYVLSNMRDRFGEIAANVVIAAAAGGFVSMIIARIRFGKADVLLTCCGVMGGLVSITAAAAVVATPSAFLIGAVAGVVVPWLAVAIDLRWKIDDPASVIAIHGGGGIWALIAAAIFRPAEISGHAHALWIQLLGIVVISVVTIALTGVLLTLLRSAVGLRSKEADEYDGLDLAEHDINAHPDFQQTMIKSYHLREA